MTFRNTRRNTTAILAAGMFGAALVLPSGAQAATLSEALANAYVSNPEIKSARRELGATNEQVPQALAGWRPEVSVSGSAGRERFEQSSAFFTSEDTVNPLSGRVEVRQPLYQGGQTPADTARAVKTVGAQRAVLRGTEQDVLLRGVQAYMDVWRDQDVLRLNENNVKRLRRQLEATRDRFEVGEVTRTDVAQAESRLSGAVADREAAAGNLEASRARYKEVIGRLPEDLEQPPTPENLPATREEAVALATENNPDVVAARFREQAANHEVRQVTGELLPNAELVGRLGRSENSTSSEASSQSAEILAQVTVPLYQRGAVTSRVRAAKQTANQRRLEMRTAERTSEQTAVSAWEDLQSARAQIESIEDQVRAADIALEGVRQEAQVGARTVLDVLDAEQELLDAQVSLVRAQRDEIVASYTVLSAIGRLSARDLELDVPIYDVDAAYEAVADKIWGIGLPEAADRE